MPKLKSLRSLVRLTLYLTSQLYSTLIRSLARDRDLAPQNFSSNLGANTVSNAIRVPPGVSISLILYVSSPLCKTLNSKHATVQLFDLIQIGRSIMYHWKTPPD
ncbi:hypothetical protein EDB86DRAFT_2889964 [Lactarius hatsudake]|nr:hypothetical protein EDB86DRAFT_2889964 [Lactarius hatsudake]